MVGAAEAQFPQTWSTGQSLSNQEATASDLIAPGEGKIKLKRKLERVRKIKRFVD